jgi:hypothetical protein
LRVKIWKNGLKYSKFDGESIGATFNSATHPSQKKRGLQTFAVEHTRFTFSNNNIGAKELHHFLKPTCNAPSKNQTTCSNTVCQRPIDRWLFEEHASSLARSLAT